MRLYYVSEREKKYKVSFSSAFHFTFFTLCILHISCGRPRYARVVCDIACVNVKKKQKKERNIWFANP